MTTIAEAREAIYLRFVTEWADRTPYTFENENYLPNRSDDAWVRLTVRHEDGGQETLGPVGSRKFSRVGRVLVQVFANPDEGLGRTDGLLQALREAFEGVTLVGTTVRFAGVTVREVGQPDDEHWFMSIMDAPFEYDETR